MRQRSCFAGSSLRVAALTALVLIFARNSGAQSAPVERLFAESKGNVDKALKQLQSSMSGRLPALEGFALVGDHPLTQYQRAFYQCTVKVTPTPAGGSIVRVSAKVTAWYADKFARRISGVAIQWKDRVRLARPALGPVGKHITLVCKRRKEKSKYLFRDAKTSRHRRADPLGAHASNTSESVTSFLTCDPLQPRKFLERLGAR